jgi:hypothetical protein
VLFNRLAHKNADRFVPVRETYAVDGITVLPVDRLGKREFACLAYTLASKKVTAPTRRLAWLGVLFKEA